jgi:hypothetical protein
MLQQLMHQAFRHRRQSFSSFSGFPFFFVSEKLGILSERNVAVSHLHQPEDVLLNWFFAIVAEGLV